MKFTIVEKAKNIMRNMESRQRYFGWPSVARLQNGKIAAVASGFRWDHICPFGKAVMALSEDNGQTYSRPQIVIDTFLDDRDAGILAYGKSDVILTSFNNTRLQQKTWRPIRDTDPPDLRARRIFFHKYLDLLTDEQEQTYNGAEYRISHDCGVTWGPVRKSPITSPHGPTCLQDGTVLWVGRCFFDEDSSRDHLEAHVINPDGSMTYLSTLPNYTPDDGQYVLNCEPHCIQLDNGRLICHIRIDENGYFSVAQCESDDCGKTWSKPHLIIGRRAGSPPHLLQLADGRVISTYGYRSDPGPGIHFAVSCDRCETWETDLVLWDEAADHDLGYPCSIQLDDGTILTVFYGRTEAEMNTDDVTPESVPNFIKQIRWKI